MDLRLTLALSLLTGVGELVVVCRLIALDLLLRYWYFGLCILFSAIQCTSWLLGPPNSKAYAAFWLCTTPVLIGLRVAAVFELWRLLSSQQPDGGRLAGRFAFLAAVFAIAISLGTGVDLWLVGWHATIFRIMSLGVRYSSSILAIFCAWAAWFGFMYRRPLPQNILRHAFLLAAYLASSAVGHLMIHLSGGFTRPAWIMMAAAETITFALWVILLSKDGETLKAVSTTA